MSNNLIATSKELVTKITLKESKPTSYIEWLQEKKFFGFTIQKAGWYFVSTLAMPFRSNYIGREINLENYTVAENGLSNTKRAFTKPSVIVERLLNNTVLWKRTIICSDIDNAKEKFKELSEEYNAKYVYEFGE